MWKDLVYEFKGYLEKWLDAMEVKDFESLTELLFAEQLKKRIPAEVRDHYLKTWDKFKTAKCFGK